MKNNKIKSIIQAFFTDLLFWIYILGCIYFLIHRWFEIDLKNIHVVIAGLVFTLIFLYFSWQENIFSHQADRAQME